MSAQYTQQKTEFNKIIVSLMDKIDEVSAKLNTGEYVEMANMLRDLNAMSVFKEIQVIQQVIRQTPHYQRLHETVTNPKKKSKEIADKMNDKHYKFCDRCDTMVCRDGFKKHQERPICKKIWTSKIMSKNTKKIATEKLHKLGQILTPNFVTHYDELKKMSFRVFSEVEQKYLKMLPDELFNNTEDDTYSEYYDDYRLDANWEGMDVFQKDIIDIFWKKNGNKWEIVELFVKN
jgi:hypothetical protein